VRLPIIALVILAASAPAIAEPRARAVQIDDLAFRVVDLDLASDRLELHWKDDAGQPLAGIDRLRDWGAARGHTLLFAANAGIYDREFRPLGLHVEEGIALRPLNTTRAGSGHGNFAMQPNGVFYVDQNGRAGVMTTDHWRERGPRARIASQSGPMLVVDGEINHAFDAQSGSLKWRSGVCAATPSHVVFAVSEAPVSFHAFARLFRDTLGCRDALYLDGTLSRLWTRNEGYAGAAAMMVKPYAGMFAVFAPDSAPE
jgi:uncharacterized protein YigE (DUF2233 family)